MPRGSAAAPMPIFSSKVTGGRSSQVSRGSSGELQPKKRPAPKEPVSVPTGDLEGFLQPHRGLALAVRDMVADAKHHFESFAHTQKMLMRAVNSYLAWDFACLDESAMVLLQVSSSFFEEGAAFLASACGGLDEVRKECDRILTDHESIGKLLEERNEAHLEYEHYNGKVASLLAQGSDRSKLQRNKEKLAAVQQLAEERRQRADLVIRRFLNNRTFHTRATLHAALGTYARTACSWGSRAAVVTKAYEDEFKVGAAVEVVGFPEGSNLHGITGVVLGKVPKTGLILIALDDGTREQAVAPKHLVPVPAPVPELGSEREEESGAAAGAAEGSAADIAPSVADASLAEAAEEPGTAKDEEALPASAAEADVTLPPTEPAPTPEPSELSDPQPLLPVAEELAPVPVQEQPLPRRRPRVAVNPSRGSCDGCDAEVTVSGFADGSPHITAVMVGHELASIVQASAESLRIRIPPGAAGGPLRVEVRRDGWEQYVMVAEAAFQYFELMGFGACGRNVRLSSPDAEPASRFLSVATRSTGLTNAYAITADAIPIIDDEEPAAETDEDQTSRRPPRRRYFEFEVADISDQKSMKALSVGYVWPTPSVSSTNLRQPSPTPAASADDRKSESGRSGSSQHASVWGRLPEEVIQLPRSLLVGGGRTKAHLAGEELCSISGWRPATDVLAGSVIGVLLEEQSNGEACDTACIVVFQNGLRRCSTTATIPLEWSVSAAPHGVVDINGTIRRVELRQGAVPPDDPRAAKQKAKAAVDDSEEDIPKAHAGSEADQSPAASPAAASRQMTSPVPPAPAVPALPAPALADQAVAAAFSVAGVFGAMPAAAAASTAPPAPRPAGFLFLAPAAPTPSASPWPPVTPDAAPPANFAAGVAAPPSWPPAPPVRAFAPWPEQPKAGPAWPGDVPRGNPWAALPSEVAFQPSPLSPFPKWPSDTRR